jgi:glycerol-3-phosphate dehydrogenase subunit C
MKYPVSMTVGSDLFAEIRASAPQIVVTECATCRMQIEQATAVKTMHPADVLPNALCYQSG